MKKQITVFISVLLLFSLSQKTICMQQMLKKFAKAFINTNKQKLSIMKLGGSAITYKGETTGKARYNIIENMCKEISKFISENNEDEKLILTTGTGSFGHPVAYKYNLNLGINKKNIQGILKCHNEVKKINKIVVTTLNKYEVPAVPIHPLSCILCFNGKILNFNTEIIQNLIESGFVPVLHGDLVSDVVSEMSILSSVQIAAYLGKVLNAKTVGFASRVDGVYDNYGNVITQIDHQTFSEIKYGLGESEYTDVSGGMLAKVTNLLSPEAPEESYLFNGTTAGNLTKILSGEHIGTKIVNKKLKIVRLMHDE